MKRTLVVLIAVMVVLTGAVMVYDRLGPSDTEPGVPSPSEETTSIPVVSPPEPEPEPWNGRGTQTVGATFFVSGHQITVKSFTFGKLNEKRANVGVELRVISATSSRRWLSNGWVMNAPNRRWTPTSSKITRSGSVNTVRLSFTKLPTAQLRGGIAFSITYPDGAGGRNSFSIAPLAPMPPREPPAVTEPSAPSSDADPVSAPEDGTPQSAPAASTPDAPKSPDTQSVLGIPDPS